MVVRVEKSKALEALSAHRRSIGASEESCVMCLLASGCADPDPVWETEEAVVVLDRFGARRGHLMVISKRHVEHLTELSMFSYMEFQALAYQATRALERALNPERTFIASLGAPRAVSTSYPHFHLHVVPLFETDERCRPARVFSWTDGVVLYEDDEAAQLAELLRNAWPEKTSLRLVGGERS